MRLPTDHKFKLNMLSCHTNQIALEVEIRFKASNDNTLAFKTSSHFSGFNYHITRAIIHKILSWALNNEIQKYTLNTKIETLDAKPSFNPNSALEIYYN